MVEVHNLVLELVGYLVFFLDVRPVIKGEVYFRFVGCCDGFAFVELADVVLIPSCELQLKFCLKRVLAVVASQGDSQCAGFCELFGCGVCHSWHVFDCVDDGKHTAIVKVNDVDPSDTLAVTLVVAICVKFKPTIPDAGIFVNPLPSP